VGSDRLRVSFVGRRCDGVRRRELVVALDSLRERDLGVCDGPNGLAVERTRGYPLVAVRMRRRPLSLLLFVIVATACSGDGHGSTVDIGGHRLFIDCRGTGSPTVILESGLTADTSWWNDVIASIAETTRVCAYDRANNGRSDPVGLHTGDQSVSDLEKLLSTRDIEPPYVLVAWSFGGPIARLFAARNPDDVVGMVLVDTDPVDYRSQGAPFVPDDVRERSYWASENDEKLDLDATLDLVRAESTPGSLDHHPLIILTPSVPNSGNIGEGGSQGLPGPRIPELDELYLRQEREMQNLSSNSRFMLVDDTGHCIMCDQPQVVLKAVKDVMQAARTDGQLQG
jgi:pimeloyl-ACP methyl ester carboxylesterase